MKYLRRHRLFLAVFAGLLANGCQVLQPRDLGPAPVVESAQRAVVQQPVNLVVSQKSDNESLVTLMRYARFISELSKRQLAEEIKKADAAYKISSTSRSRLKLAVLLSYAPGEFQDEKRAIKMLNEMVIGSSGKDESALFEYAHMLLVTLQERADASQRQQDLDKALKEERSLRQQLEQKLEALKSIEQSIVNRQNEAQELKP